MEQGKLVLNSKEFDLRKCMEECVESFRFQAEAAHKALSLNVDVRDAEVMGDPFRIGQVMNNLLSNAVKFTREGDCIALMSRRWRPPPASFASTVW